MIGFSYLYQWTQGVTEPMLDRFLGAGILLGCWILSFSSRINAQTLNRMLLANMVLLTVHSIWINYHAGFPIFYLITYLLVVQLIFLIFQEQSQLWYYFTLVLGGWGLGLWASDIPFSHAVFQFASVLLITTVNILMGIQRISFIKDLAREKQQKVESEQTLKAVFGSSQDLIWSLDREGRLQTFNQAFAGFIETLIGIRPELGQQISKNVAIQGSHKSLEACYAQAFTGERVHAAVWLEQDGIQRYFTIIFNPILEGETIVGLANFARDITDRKRKSEELFLYRKAIEHTGEAIRMTDTTGKVIYQNPAFEQLVDDKTAHVDPADIATRYQDPQKVSQLLETVRRSRTGSTEEVILHTIDGRELIIDLRIDPIISESGEMLGFMSTHRDVTRQRKTEQQLANNERRYALAIEGINDGIWDWNLLTNETYLSPRFKEMVGYDEHEFPNDINILQRLIHPEDISWVMEELKAHIKGKTEQVWCEFRVMHKDGSETWALGRGKGEYNAEGKTVRMTGSLTDITAQKQLEFSLQGVLDSSVSGIMALRSVRDEAGEIIDFEWTLVNKMACELLGFSAEQLVHQRMLQLIPGKLKDGLFDKYCEVVKTGVSQEFEHLNVNESCVATWLHKSVVRKEDGFVITFSNVTERKEREEELRILSLVASKTEAAVVITDRFQKIEWVNEGYCRLTGYSTEEVVGQKAGSFMRGPESSLEASKKIGANLRQGLSASGEILNYRKDGSSYWVALNISPIYEKDEIVRFIAVETDITARKEAEQALVEAKEAAEQAAEAKANFLATMSHEIRTPMNAVIGMTGLLRETQLDEEQREYVETVRLSGNNLLTIINDILDFSKIDAGHLELESQPFHLRKAVEDVLDLLSGKAHKQGVELVYEMDPLVPTYIAGDPTRLNQVLVNLISNAIKFSKDGEVILSVKSMQSDMLEFRVKDTGIGISAEKLSRLFQPFSQVDASTTRKYGGTGLGLVISKKLVELMGGAIGVISEPGVGSTFYFSIHALAAEAPAETEKPIHLNLTELADRLILLVDDNETNLRLLSQLLKAGGMRTIATTQPQEAIGLLQNHPDITAAILDMQMPEMDGVHLAKAIKQLPGYEAFPLILLTSMHEFPAKSDQAFFGAMLHKPVRQESLFRQMHRLICPPVSPEKQDAQAAIPASYNAPTMPKISILLAEDNLINQKVAVRILSKLGYTAEVAANGLEAIKMMELRTFDLVFMDMQMPEMDGLEATQEIRSRWAGDTYRPVIVAMTANALKEDRDRCLAAGMDDYLSKPITKEDIARMILQWFGQPEISSTHA